MSDSSRTALTAPDMGVLRVDVLNAKGLGAADRSGKSDVSLSARSKSQSGPSHH